MYVLFTNLHTVTKDRSLRPAAAAAAAGAFLFRWDTVGLLLTEEGEGVRERVRCGEGVLWGRRGLPFIERGDPEGSGRSIVVLV